MSRKIPTRIIYKGKMYERVEIIELISTEVLAILYTRVENATNKRVV